MTRGEMNFVEPDKHDQFYNEVFAVSPADAAIVTEQVKDVYAKIKNHEFDKGCGKEHCHWCNFVKYYLKKEIQITDALPGSAEEEVE
jgi:hypothetical protein